MAGILINFFIDPFIYINIYFHFFIDWLIELQIHVIAHHFFIIYWFLFYLGINFEKIEIHIVKN